MLQGLITGIGFIGGGAILKSSGTATAASIWNTGLIGMAVAFGRFEIAIFMSLINFVTLRYVRRFKDDSGEGRALIGHPACRVFDQFTAAGLAFIRESQVL